MSSSGVLLTALSAVAFGASPAIASGTPNCGPGATMQYQDNTPYAVYDQVYLATTQTFIDVQDVVRTVAQSRDTLSYSFTGGSGVTFCAAYVSVLNRTTNTAQYYDFGLTGPVTSLAFQVKQLPENSSQAGHVVRSKSGQIALYVHGGVELVDITGNDANF